MNIGKKWLSVGCLSGFLAVLFGAFGAHGIEQMLPTWYTYSDLGDEETATTNQNSPVSNQHLREDLLNALLAQKLKTWTTGVRYHFYSTMAILAVGFAASIASRVSRSLEVAGVLLVLGLLGFSGSLYLLVVTKISVFGMIAAVGGTMQLAGWIMLGVGIWRSDWERVEPGTGGQGKR
ncbi:DUF423 domain-containing protein [Mariniblastus sp.]|jgi:uncharacterized membrane protein YgdD (TMEM256/DUF423 family)|nr:DUF423 domain-containing protein [Mariniblastus sp.]MDB4756680.1 DUF423 domain-containing protein [Mariniblastus sp.]